MLNFYLRAPLVALLLAAAPAAFAQTPGVGIGTTAPDASAALDIVSSTKGALLPRVASAAALASPATGLLVFQTGAPAGFYYNAGTAALPNWRQLNPVGGPGDNLGNHTATTNLGLNGNWLSNGPANANGLRVDNTGKVGVGTATPGHPLTVQADGSNRVLGINTSTGTDKYNLSLSNGGLNLSESNVAGGRLFVKDGGNVGIGTTNPSQKLDVAGSAVVQGKLGVGTATPTTQLDVRGDLQVAAASADPVSNPGPTGSSIAFTNVGQSFTVTAPATITSVTLTGDNDFNTTLTLYAGTGNGGTALTSPQAITLVDNVPTTYVLTTPLAVAAGVYTLALTTNGSNFMRVFASNTYSGGALTTNTASFPSYDLEFAVGFAALGGPTLYASTAGKVGIGTATPTATLDVSGSTRLRGLTTPGAVMTDASGNLTSAALPVDADTQQLSISGSTISLTNGGSVVVPSSADNLGNHTATANLNLGANQLVGNGGSTGLSITNGGNVGIGTATPATTLDVRTANNSAAITVGKTDGTAGALNLGNSGHGLQRNYNGGANDVGLYTTAGNLYLSATGVNTGQFVLLNNGNVGIGGSPSQKLDVAGTTRTTGLQVTSGAAAGRVLTSDATGNATWTAPSLSVSGQSLSIGGGNTVALPTGADNLGNHTATTNLNLGTNLLTGNGGSSGLAVSSTGGVGIGGTAPASAALAVTSTTRGFLPPRMSQTERDAIAAPTAGLTIYNTVTNKLNVWNGTSWTESLTSTEEPFQHPVATFTFTGNEQTYTVPTGVTSLIVDASGAQGGSDGSSSGGNGGRVQTTLTVTPGEVLRIYVGGAGSQAPLSGSGGAGYNGGGLARQTNGGGGGGTDIRRGGAAIGNRIVVAGGGGGAASAAGGAGGGTTGGAGSGPYAGQGGTPTAGGTGGTGLGNGTLALGGDGVFSGGGGGWYGGGGGGRSGGGDGGGGGGSSYVTTTGSSGTVHTQNYRSGGGILTLTPSGLSYAAPTLSGTNFLNVPTSSLTGVVNVANLPTLTSSASGTNRTITLGTGNSTTISVGDDLGSHNATTRLNLGANQLVGNGGTSGLSITNGGFVGVGTTIPGHPLAVQATGGGAMLGFNNSSGTDKYNFSLTNGGLNLSESNVAAGRLFVQDGGNVGIATTGPTATLDVNGSARVRGLTRAGVVQTDASGNLSASAAASVLTSMASAQKGTSTLGPGGAGVNVYTINFPTAFGTAPSQVLVTMRTAAGQVFNDTFSVTTKAIGSSSFQVNVQRTDANAAWGQALLLDWLALP